jgi:hypothetical protein
MLTECELKDRLGLILGIEEQGEQADWFAIASLSIELLQELPSSAAPPVRAYLTDYDIRRVNRSFANDQRLALVQYLRSSHDQAGPPPE